ncbi:ribonuclease 3 [Podospora australis]|uniref:Ribonuclease 3 n=1 Tax=Podospora australis TaxID=1536484 RepID=A0AAN6WZ16_9PEZI|nr:ribonuclease 3 [Podospora australis]
MSKRKEPVVHITAEPAPKRTKSDQPAVKMGFSPMTYITKWKSSEITREYPPIPKILDPALETAALTHSGLRKRPSDQSYERLEWIGDIYCELISSELIYETWPTLSEGKMSQYRELLVRNSTLSGFSLHYGLDKKANFPPEFEMVPSDSKPVGLPPSEKSRAKALGDIFEAYVGALIRSDPVNGYKTAVEWLKALWGPILAHYVREEESGGRKVDQDISPKTQLEQQIGASGIRIEYRDIPSNKMDKETNAKLFTVGCYLHGWGEEGLELGRGSALGKKEAGQQAALIALGKKKLIKKFNDKKKAFVAAKQAQYEAARQEQEQAGES